MRENGIGARMKHNYEDRSRFSLLRRTPVIIRVDGKAFHTYTRNCDRPFDEGLIEAMATAATATACEMSGFRLGYVQSDEASFLLRDDATLTTEAWFDNNVQKLASVTASLMTGHFNDVWSSGPGPAFFDGRCFNMPEAEVANYFLWRARDWSTNSLEMLARAHFSAKQLHRKGASEMHEMLHDKGVNWADLAPVLKNGTWIRRDFSTRTDLVASYDSITELLAEQSQPGGPLEER
jgi:tRNA(His) guanylyltransferase